MSSRYVTPSIMAWAALFVLYLPDLIALMKKHDWARYLGMGSAALTLTWMIIVQLQVFQVPVSQKHNRMMAALALEMDVGDNITIKNVYPNMRAALSIASKATEHDISVFGLPLFIGLRDQMGHPIEKDATQTCIGAIDRYELMVEDPEFLRVHGWMFDAPAEQTPSKITFVGPNNQVPWPRSDRCHTA